MKKVIVLGTGGTIASTAAEGAGAVATSSITDLLTPLAHDFEIDARDVMTVGSYNIGFFEMRVIAQQAIAAACEPNVTGVVVTHGTDTMEETAYLTHLLYGSGSVDAPIVFTGAQFAADTIAPDGSRNLSDALAFAAHKSLRGVGVGIAFGGELASARGTRKAQTLAPSPFSGGALLARRRGDEVSLHARIAPERRPLEITSAFDTQIIDVIVSAPGIDPSLFTLAAQRADAVILMGTGVGNAGPGFARAVANATDNGTPVVLSTRVNSGPVTPIYGNGGGADLIAAGAVSAAELGHAQSRVLAAALLASAEGAPESPAAFAAQFAQYTQ